MSLISIILGGLVGYDNDHFGEGGGGGEEGAAS